MRIDEITGDQNLSEMRIRHHTRGGDMLIAFRDSIWIADADDFENNVDGLWDSVLGVIGGDVSFDYLRDERPDVLVGSYDSSDDSLHIDSTGHVLSLHPRTSKLIQKVVRHLGIDRVNDVDMEDDATELDKSAIRGKLPEYGYHGTSLSKLRGILKTGISSQSMGNWGDIRTEGVIFFAADSKIPRFHANRTARQDNDVPVIIKFKIPDEDRIISDYDVAAGLYGLGGDDLPDEYMDSHTMPDSDNKVSAHHKRPKNLWRDMGVFGYKGRIPPKFFSGFYTTYSAPSEYGDVEFIPLNRRELADLMKIYVFVIDELDGDIQDYISSDWMDYAADEVIGDLRSMLDEY